jgi:hypothetical protein
MARFARKFGLDKFGATREDLRAWYNGAGSNFSWGSVRSFVPKKPKPAMETPAKKKKFKQSQHQKDVARATMARLRKEQPEKFRGNRRKPKPADPAPEIKPVPTEAQALRQPAAQPTNPPAVSPATLPEPARVGHENVQPMPVNSDTTLFGTETVPPPKIETGQPAPPPQPPPGTPGTGTAAPAVTAPAGEAQPDVKKYAVMIWGMIVKICTSIFGEGFKPITIKSETGEVIYDENAEGIKVWWNWLVSIGVKVFPPVVELWMFMLAYFAIRFPLIVARFRKKKTATTPPAPPAEATTPPPPGENREAQPPQPRESAPQPTPTAAALQASAEERAAAVENLN